MKNKLNPTQKLVLSAIIMALYIAILFISQAISFGAVPVSYTHLAYFMVTTMALMVSLLKKVSKRS